jgi:hypothetical protein
MEQLTLLNEITTPVGYLPCANPELVTGYIAIEEILRGRSSDFGECDECDVALCEHALDVKRADESYEVLVEHFRHGGMINQPISYDMRNKEQCNGHHRLAAAYDAGFTHIPYQNKWGSDDWTGVNAEAYGFRIVTDSWGAQDVREI